MTSLPETFVEGFHDEDAVRRMEYNALGNTGLQVSKISYGCGTLSSLYGELDVEEAVRTIHKAIKSGVNYVDTAPWYGQGRSESVLGKALKAVPRQSYYVATKVGRYSKNYAEMFDFTAKRVREGVEHSLQLLGLDYVDVIQIHDIEFAENLDIIVNETLPELEKLVKEGKVKFIGVTGYPLSCLKECIERAPGRFNVVLAYTRYTLIDDTLKSYLEFFKQQGVGVVCASVHAMGLLTNAGPQSWHPANEQLKALCRQAAELCASHQVELARLAMHYAIQPAGPATFLTGMQTRQLLDMNLDVYCNGITKEEHFLLQQLRERFFTKSYNWEGVEVNNYRLALKDIAEKKQKK